LNIESADEFITLGRVARKWQESGKKVARKWQESGKKVAIG
jgi:hypothetical protein